MVLKDVTFFGVRDVHYICDCCLERLSDGDVQHRCWQCKSFDLCAKCWKTKANRHGHSFFSQTVVTKLPERSTVVALTLRNALLHFNDHLLFGDREFDKHGNPDQDATDFIISNTNVEVVFCSGDQVDKFLACAQKFPILKLIVQFGSADSKSTIKSATKVVTFSKLAAQGKASKLNIWTLYPWPAQDDLFTVQYTSGSTGTPKGVMINHGAYLSQIARPYGISGVMFSYEPLAHSTRRNDQTGILHGCRIGFHSGDMERLFEEIQIIRPTAVAGVPRVWNKIFAEYQKALQLASIQNKLNDKQKIERNVLREFRHLLGDRITGISCGGAPTSPAVVNFLKRCFRCTVMDSYGATETGGISIDSKIDASGIASMQIKLLDWEEYKSTDNPPRGELLVKSKALAVGYYNNKEDTEESFVNGWFHTGDIVSLEPGGQVKVIGRKKQIFKLAQGEYISPERLENIFLRSALIDQVFVHGDSVKTNLVAVIVINAPVVIAQARESGTTVDSTQVCHSLEVKDMVQADIIRWAGVYQLRPFEVPICVHLTTEPFSVENGLLTSTNKLNRNALLKRFQGEIEAMYQSASKSVSVDAVSSQMRKSNEKHILGVLGSILNVSVDRDDSDVRSKRFQDLGGDSLGAVRLRQLVRENFTVDLSLQQIFDSSSVENLVNLITRLQKSDDELVTEANRKFAETSSQPVLDGGSWSQSSSESSSSLQQADPGEISPHTTPDFSESHILITGVTGFIGMHLLSQLLETTPDGTLVYCLVRPSGKSSGFKRLRRLMKRAELWKTSFKRQIRVLEGDLGRPLLGLLSEAYNDLASKVATVYHAGALVNAVLSYSEHYRANVFGTAELIRLCRHSRHKVLHHISTLSVFKAASGGLYCTESIPLSQVPKPPHSDAYSRTKYEAEEVVMQARERGLQTNIYRLGAISGHSETGHSNTSDYTTRLLVGISTLGIPDGCSSVHLELTPVDYASKAIIQISRDGSSTNRNFHITSKPKQFAMILPIYKELGYELESHVWDAWHADLVESPDNPLFPLLHYFEGGSWPWARECDGWFAESLVAKAGLKIEADFPSRARKQLIWLKSKGILPDPQTCSK